MVIFVTGPMKRAINAGVLKNFFFCLSNRAFSKLQNNSKNVCLALTDPELRLVKCHAVPLLYFAKRAAQPRGCAS